MKCIKKKECANVGGEERGREGGRERGCVSKASLVMDFEDLTKIPLNSPNSELFNHLNNIPS
jgi:hypothetical protein